MKSSTVAHVAIFGSFAIFGAAVVFVIYRIRKNKNKSSNLITLTITLDNSFVTSLLEKNEKRLKNIEQLTGTVIKFNEKDGKSHSCEITGELENVERAESMIKNEMKEATPVLEEVLEIPNFARPKIIGLCGETLEEICATSNAQVWIENSKNVDNCIVKFTGTLAQISIAKKLVNDKIKLAKESIAITDSKPKNRPDEPKKVTQTPEPRNVLLPKKLSISNTVEPIEVFVSAVVDPSKFYIQIIGPQLNELDLLTSSLTEYYSNPENQQKHAITNPAIGQLVAATFDNDDRYYRAEIVSIQPNSVIDLVFIDFGDNLYVFPKDIFELKDEFLGLKCQAVECFLAGVKPINKETPQQWSQKCNERFDDLVYVANFKNRLTAKVITFKSGTEPTQRVPGLELLDFNNGKNINIAQVLIAENLAEPSTTGVFGDLIKSSVLKEDKAATNNLPKEITVKPIELNLKLVTEKTLLEESLKEQADLIAKTKKENLENFTDKRPPTSTEQFLTSEREQDLPLKNKSTDIKNNKNFEDTEEIVKAELLEGEKAVQQFSDLLK